MKEMDLADRNTLQMLEQQIKKGFDSFIEVSDALWRINHEKLYREQHSSFEDYCRAKWDMSRSRAYQYINAAATVRSLKGEVSTIVDNEAKARAIAKVPEADREGVLLEAKEKSGGVPTAKEITEAANANAPKTKPQPIPTAIKHADTAIKALKRIQENDPDKEASYDKVIHYINSCRAIQSDTWTEGETTCEECTSVTQEEVPEQVEVS